MTDLRKAAQQALEALEEYQYHGAPFLACDGAVAALRAALAQQDEPVQEPVAKVELMTTGGNAGLATRIVEIDDHLRERLRPGQLLYTAPPQRKPLTEDEIDRICASLGFAAISPAEIVRAVERAHGIGETR